MPTTLCCASSAVSAISRACSREPGGVVLAGVNGRPRNKCRSTKKPISSLTRMECATPFRPARATLPTLCTKSLGRGGKSKFTTLSSNGMSIPRAATSVTTNTLVFRARNFPMFNFRAAKSMVPYTELHENPSCSKTVTNNSTWCLVAANTTVCCLSGTTSRNKYNKAGIFSSIRTTVNESFKSGDTFISASKRMTWGSRRPTLTNSASAVGMVAENNKVCLISATCLKMSRSWSLNPISSNRSASSRHTMVTLRIVNPSTSSTM